MKYFSALLLVAFGFFALPAVAGTTDTLIAQVATDQAAFNSATTRYNTAIAALATAANVRAAARGTARTTANQAYTAAGAEKLAANNALWAAKNKLAADTKALAKAQVAAAASTGTVLNVSNDSQLVAAFAGLANGARATINLRPGTYQKLMLKNKNFGAVTLIGDATNFPVMLGLKMNNVSNITFRQIEFRLADPQAETWAHIVDLATGMNVNFVEDRFRGPTSYLAASGAIGIGLAAVQITNLSLTKSDFAQLYIGASFVKQTNLVVNENTIMGLRKDAMNLVGITGGMIMNNVIDHFNPAPGDHPDHIQFWAKSPEEYSSSVKIIGNRLLGVHNQAVFMRCYDACPISYRDILIKDNYHTGEMRNGIAISGGKDIVIDNNTMVGTMDGIGVGILTSKSQNVTITHNIANVYSFESDAAKNAAIFTNNKIVHKGVIPANLPSLINNFASLENVNLHRYVSGVWSQAYK